MAERIDRDDANGTKAGEGSPRRAPRIPLGGPSPFSIGFAAAIGVGIAYLLFQSIELSKDILILVGVSLFFAAGLDPAVRLVQKWGLPRGLSVGVVFLVLAGAATGFGVVVVPPLIDQIREFAANVPGYLDHLQHNRRISDLDTRFHFIDKIRNYASSGNLAKTLAGNVVTVGTTLATTVFEGFSVLILTLYFMAYLDDIVDFGYRMVPRSRRDRAQLIGAKITEQMGAYVAGNLLLAVICGVVSFIWLWAVGAPFPFALAFVVTLLDVIPLVGAPVAAIVVSSIVALESQPAGIATLIFFVVYQIAENYLVMPRLLGTDVRVNPAATIVGALAGATLFGVIGFLLALPLVAMGNLILREVVVPRQAER